MNLASVARHALIGGMALAGAGCGTSPRPADVVVYASGTDLESANPLVTIHPLSRQIQRHVLFVTLTRYDSTLRTQPYFARGWTWARDHRAVTMALEPTLRWHDGVPTTARDVAFTLRVARDPRVGFARAGDLAVLDSVVALDDSTLRVAFSRPIPELPGIFAELPIAPEHLLRDVALEDMRRAAFNLKPVGNGPFRFAERVTGQRWVFDRNDGFPSSMGGPPAIRSLVVTVVDEPTTKFAGLASGDLDFAGIAPTMAALASRDPMIRVLDYPVLFSTALIFNVGRPPFDDVRVRQAVDMAIDRPRIVNAALAGYASVASGPVPPENPLALQRAPSYAPAQSDSLLDAAGWLRATDGFRSRLGTRFDVELLTVGSGDNAVEQLVQADLAARGIRVEIRQLELAAFLAQARAARKTFDMLITGIPGDLSLGYLGAMYESRQRGSAVDYADFHMPALDRLFARARDARNDEEARSAWRELQTVLSEQMPAVWLYHSRGLQGVSARMRNVTMDLRGEMATVSQWSTRDASARVAVKP